MVPIERAAGYLYDTFAQDLLRSEWNLFKDWKSVRAAARDGDKTAVMVLNWWIGVAGAVRRIG